MKDTGETAIQETKRSSMLGNQNAAVHGLYTRDKDALKLRARSVRRLVNKAYQLCPWLTPTDRPVTQSWAETVKLKAICFTVLEKLGAYRADGDDLAPRRLLNEYRLLSQLELTYAKELGLTPQSRMSLGIKALEGGDLAAQMQAMKNGVNDGD